MPSAVRRLITGVAISALGTGLTLPYTLIFLHEVRGIALPTTGLLLAIPGVISLFSVPAAGALIDRFGPRAVLRATMALQAAANVVLAFAETPTEAVPALLLLGFGLGPSFPAAGALMSSLVSGPELQARAFGLQFTILNACIGIGGLTGAAIIDIDRPLTFVVLYLGNAASCLAYAALVPPAPASAPVPDEVEVAPPSYREVLSDPVFRRVCLVSLLFALTGYAALDGGFPAFARVVGEVPPQVIGLAFAANTALITAGQLLVLRLIKGRRRSLALAGAALLWALSWALLGLVAGLSAVGGVIVVLAFACVFGLGETLMAPCLGPLVNALATDRLRGRYNAMSGATFSIAFVVGPALAGVLIGTGLGLLWLGLLVAGALGAARLAWGLRSRLTDEQDGLVPAAVSGAGA
ncbi:MAG TPA: MFS transporter [Mycobacteriales bacterium]|nr:MFS transporter [Mycobacteriales bacterium]